MVIILTERRGYIQYCGVYIQYCNAFPILPKPVIFNTNQEISLFANIYLINPSYMKEKKSIIDLYNTVLHEDLRKYTGLRHLPPTAAETTLIVQTLICCNAFCRILKINF